MVLKLGRASRRPARPRPLSGASVPAAVGYRTSPTMRRQLALARELVDGRNQNMEKVRDLRSGHHIITRERPPHEIISLTRVGCPLISAAPSATLGRADGRLPPGRFCRPQRPPPAVVVTSLNPVANARGAGVLGQMPCEKRTH